MYCETGYLISPPTLNPHREINEQTSSELRARRLGLTVLVACISFIVVPAASAASQTGYRDFTYGTGIDHAPTEPKPESKVWWNDGTWWACLYNTNLKNYDIHLTEQSGMTLAHP